MKEYKSLSSTTQERIRDLLRPVLGEVDDPKAAQLLSPMQGLEGISSESLQDLERAVGNVMNDIKTQYEMLKQSAANGESDGANEVRRCGG